MAKTKVTVSGLGDIEKRFKRFLYECEHDREMLIDVAVTSREQIIKRTIAGLDEYKQPALKETTIKRRKKLIAIGNGDYYAKPARSNLTLSGQLLNSIAFSIDAASGAIRFILKDAREAYIGLRGKDIENDMTNTEIKKDLESRGRKFMFLSDKLKANLATRIIRHVRRKLSNYKKLRQTLK